MAPLNTLQKAMVKQYTGVTSSDKRLAEQALRASNWNLSAAVDNFFASGQPASAANKAAEGTLNKMFDKYRDDPANNPDTIQMSGAMTYFKDIAIDIEDTSLLVTSEFLGCATLGDIPRPGFVAAWGPLSATTLTAQRSHLTQLTQHFTTPEARAPGGLYRRVYKHTFKLACPLGAKSVPLETATEFWKQLFGNKGMPWESADHKIRWLDLYLDFLGGRWKKAVNKDLWDQTLLFALKTLDDPSLGWWSEDSAWPGIIDEFVAWINEKRAAGGDAMDVE